MTLFASFAVEKEETPHSRLPHYFNALPSYESGATRLLFHPGDPTTTPAPDQGLSSLPI